MSKTTNKINLTTVDFRTKSAIFKNGTKADMILTKEDIPSIDFVLDALVSLQYLQT